MPIQAIPRSTNRRMITMADFLKSLMIGGRGEGPIQDEKDMFKLNKGLGYAGFPQQEMPSPDMGMPMDEEMMDPDQQMPIEPDPMMVDMQRMALEREQMDVAAQLESLIPKADRLGIMKSEEKKVQLINDIVERFNYANRYMTDLYDIWDNIDEAFDCERDYTVPKGVEKPKSHIRSALMLKHIENFVALNTLRVLDPYKNYIIMEEMPDKNRAYKEENYLFDMTVERSYGPKMVDCVTNAAKYGVGISKSIPRYDSEMPASDMESVVLRDFFKDPDSATIDDSNFLFHRMWLTHEEIEERLTKNEYVKSEVEAMFEWAAQRRDEQEKEHGVDSLDAQAVERPGPRKSTGDAGVIKQMGLLPLSESDSGNKRFDRYLIYEYYDRGRVITVGEEKFYLKGIPNKDIGYPFVAWYCRLPRTGEFWVKSIAELLLPLQHESDIKRNQRVDNINKMLNMPLLYTKMAMGITNIEKIAIDANSKIMVNDIEGLKFLEYKDGTGSTTDELALLERDAQDITSVRPAALGDVAKKERMGTQETNAVYGNAMMKFDYCSNLLVLTGVIPLLKLTMKILSLQGKIARASANPTGRGPAMDIMPNDFKKKYLITVSINPNKVEADSQKAKGFYDRFSMHPFIEQEALLQYVIPLMDPNAPIERLIKPESMMQPAPGQGPGMQGGAKGMSNGQGQQGGGQMT